MCNCSLLGSFSSASVVRYFNFTNQIDVYSPTIEGFGVGIHASYGDTTHIYNAYLGNDNGVLCNCSDVGIRIAEDM